MGKETKKIIQSDKVNFDGMEPRFFLLGILSVFDNKYQATADTFFDEISWKQFFMIICIKLFEGSPTINELSEIAGSSHQNVKQILNKLESRGFVEIVKDEEDKRKQRIKITDKTRAFIEQHDENSKKVVEKICQGIDLEEINTTIKTIVKMIDNLNLLEKLNCYDL